MNEKLVTSVRNRKLQIDSLKKQVDRQKQFFSNVFYGLTLAVIATMGSCGYVNAKVNQMEEENESLTYMVIEQDRELDQLEQEFESLKRTFHNTVDGVIK